jgi:hypothetical protein
MFAQLLESLRTVSESSMQAGQEMLKQWLQHAPSSSLGATSSPREWTEAFQKRWSESATEALKKHRELIDATYQSGIEVIEQTFRTGGARSLEEHQRLVEHLWRKLSDTYKSQTEEQFREFQNATADWLTMTRNGGVAHAATPARAQAGQ